MNILAIDTSCDETAAAVIQNVQATSNKIWSQASLHSSFGGVMPSLAKREHEKRISWVVGRAIGTKHKNLEEIDAIAVTIGPGLAVALGVGIDFARNFAKKYKKPLIPVNHIEAHLLSPLARSKNTQGSETNVFPAFGVILSGGTTLLCRADDIGKYKILAETQDDALGEALDKAARFLGFGYPGAPILEEFAKKGNPDKFELPTPLINDKIKDRFSYSGLKTAFVRLYDSIKNPNKQDLYDLAASFQNVAFKHVENVLTYQIQEQKTPLHHLLFGGGVANNTEIRKRLRRLCKKHNIKLHTPYSKKLMSDNAAMVGVCAYLKNKNLNRSRLVNLYTNYDDIDRNPKLGI